MQKSIYITLFMILIAGIGINGDCSARNNDTETIEKTFTIDDDSVFRVEVDFVFAEFRIFKNASNRKCRIRIEYNAFLFEASVNYDRHENILSLEVDKGRWFSGGDKDKNDSSEDRCDTKHVKVVLELPERPVTDIDANVKAGDIECNLGGLRITNFYLRSWAGRTKVVFDEPNRTDMETFEVNCSVGETELQRLGNAHFGYASINSGIGTLRLDFLGDTIENARAEIDLDIGETEILVPDDAG